MVKSNREVEEFAEKVARFCTQNGLKAMLRALASKNQMSDSKRAALKALHFPTLDRLQPKKKNSTNLPKTLLRPLPNKRPKKISIDLLFRAKPLSENYKLLYGAAFDAHKCCRNQDLHLYRHKQIYEQKRLSLKDVKGWKFPKTFIAINQLNYYVDQIQTFKDRRSSPQHVKMIVVGKEGTRKSEEEKRIKEHLEYQKLLKAKRDYINQKSIFS